MKAPFLRIVAVASAMSFVLCAQAATYYVDRSAAATGDGSQASPFLTIAEGVAAAAAGDVVRVASGTYTITATISISKGITVQPDPDKPGRVTVDANKKCRVFDINHADAVVEGLRIYRGRNAALTQYGGGVRFGTKGGTLRNCTIESCCLYQNTANQGGGGVYIPAGATVTGCVIKDCYNDCNSATRGIAAYVDGGTLEKTLVTGSSRTAYADYQNALGAVYLNAGTVDRCTIVANEVSHGPLYVVDNASAVVRDTIVWGNTAFRDTGSGRPNVRIGASASVSGLCTTRAFGSGSVVANPSFIDAAGGDYRLSPASPCIGAGTGGADLGYADYDAGAAPLGIAVSAFSGTDSLSATVSLVAVAGTSLAGATVTWEGLPETGASFTHAFGPGNHTLTANVTFADASTATVSLANAIRVTCSGDIYVDDDSAAPALPYASPDTAAKSLEDALAIAGNGAVIHVAEGSYVLAANCHYLLDGIKIVGSGARDATTLTKKNKAGRFFYLANANAAICNLTMKDGSASGCGGGLWIAGAGGTVSNCTVQGCSTGASQKGGGVLMNSAAALLTHSLILKNTSGVGAVGAGICLSQGTVSDCLIISNTVNTLSRSGSNGGGIALDASTENAKVVNCTIAQNSAYNGGGIYRAADAGFVYNTIVFANSSYLGNADIQTVAGTTRPVASSILNCCTTASVGTGCQVVTTAPYELPSYALSGTASALCIDKGTNDYVVSTVDYAGANRIVNGTVDIGAFEYNGTMATVSFLANALTAAGPSDFTFTATAVGLDIATCFCEWFFDGAATADGTGSPFTKTLGVGRHGVKLVVTDPNRNKYTHEEAEGYITVYPADAYVDVAGTNPVWPYATPETAATDLNTAVAEVLVSGVTLHVAEGDYLIAGTVSVGAGERIVGAGMDRTCIWAKRTANSGLRILSLNGRGAYVEGVCVSNGYAQGGGVYISGDGGTFTKGRITRCRGNANQPGGGAFITGSRGKISNSDIVGNETSRYDGGADGTGVDHSGGGVYVAGGCILENCLVRLNRARAGGGVLVSDSGVVRNCTIVSNWTETTATSLGGGGGICVRHNASVVNSIVWGNSDSSISAPDSPVHNVGGDASRLSNCCAPVTVGANCLVDNPRFRNEANGDYRLSDLSPCRRTGLYQSWMEGATDFFGNPRAYSRKHCDIGFHQTGSDALRLFVR